MMKKTRTRGTRASRREGVALVVVVALLGILFVVGVVFLKSMRFEAQSLQIQQERVDRDTAIGSIVNRFAGEIARDVVDDNGIAYAPRKGRPTDVVYDNRGSLVQPTYGELLGVHTLFGQPEATATDLGNPYYGARFYSAAADMEQYLKRSFTPPPNGIDLRLVMTAPVIDSNNDQVIDQQDWLQKNIENRNGDLVDSWGDFFDASDFAQYPDGMVDWVDADGDGINDSRQFRLSALGIADEQVRELKRLVNDPTISATGEPGVGMTVVDHGAMVNLSYAHPLLINTILLDDYKVRPTVDWASALSRKYSPGIEEPPLRRRGGLIPPRVLPPTTLYGSPFDKNDCTTVPNTGELVNSQVNYLLPCYPRMADGGWRSWTLEFHEPLRSNDPEPYWLFNVMMTPWTQGSGGPTIKRFFEKPGCNDDFAQADVSPYNRRRLLTTVSHDDLFSRYVQGQGGQDVTKRMRNRYDQIVKSGSTSTMGPEVSALTFLSFYQYPCVDLIDIDVDRDGVPDRGDGVADVSSCPDFDGDGAMEQNLGGRLMLSLPWIEKELLTGLASGIDGVNGIDYLQQQIALGGAVDPADAAKADATIALVQATFTRLLLNYAQENPLPPFFDVNSPAFGGRDLDDFDYNNGGTADRFDLISYLAASMTANLIDFADQGWDPQHLVKDADGRTRPGYEDLLYDDPSTAVPLRVSDPGSDRFGQIVEAVDANGYGLGIPETARGLERQPYITEVTVARSVANDGTKCPPIYAVELFTPYNDAVFDLSRYALYVARPGGFENGKLYRIDITPPTFLPQPQMLSGVPVELRPHGYFCVLEAGNPDMLYSDCKEREPALRYALEATFELVNGDVVHLVKFNHGYDGAFHAVDSFALDGANIGNETSVASCTPEGWKDGAYSMERRMRRDSDDQLDRNYWTLDPTLRPGAKHRWMAAIGEAPDGDFNAFDGGGNCQHSLGFENGKNPDDDKVPDDKPNKVNLAAIRDVEIEFADTGSLESAYPTTASMLYMMRYANLRDGAFTRMLVGEKGQIDNGRLPVFDNGVPDPNNPNSPLPVHHVDPAGSAPDQPGGLKQLPWGQTVFDYFTALPLETVVDPEHEKPVVDDGGFRVNGRINLNSAPWSVMSGLPVSQMSAMPLPYVFTPQDSGVDSDGDGKNEVRWLLKPKIHDALRYALLTDEEIRNQTPLSAYTTYPVGYRLAKAITGYREAAALADTADLNLDGNVGETEEEQTGDYGLDGAGGRTWSGAAPQWRRGTGLMTVGELANVRHPEATMWTGTLFSGVRFDLGVNGRQLNVNDTYRFVDENYGEAVALLAAMSDWATTRSHVFSLYGTIRGNADFDGDGMLTIADLDLNDDGELDKDEVTNGRLRDLDKRAIRFEETLDRFPALLGKSKPASVGQRVIGSYSDAYSD